MAEFDYTSAVPIQEREDASISFDAPFDYSSALPLQEGQVSPEVPSVGAYLKYKYQQGHVPLVRGAFGRAAMFGDISVDEALAKADQAHLEQVEESGYLQELKFRENPVKFALGEAAAYLPGMIEGMKKGLKSGIVTGGGFAAIAGVAGQSGPQAFTLEEIYTIPGSFVAGLGTGFGFGIFKHSFDNEGGNMFLDLVKEGVDKDTAGNLAMAGGMISGLLEVGGFKLLAAPFKKKFANLIRGKTARATLVKIVQKYFQTVGGEVAIEDAQEFVNISVETLAGMIEENPDIVPTREEIVERLKQVTIKTTAGMSVIAAPGAAVSGGRALSGKKAAQPQVQPGIQEDLTEIQESVKQRTEGRKQKEAESKAKVEQVQQESSQRLGDLERLVNTFDPQNREAAIERLPVSDTIKGRLITRLKSQEEAQAQIERDIPTPEEIIEDKRPLNTQIEELTARFRGREKQAIPQIKKAQKELEARRKELAAIPEDQLTDAQDIERLRLGEVNQVFRETIKRLEGEKSVAEDIKETQEIQIPQEITEIIEEAVDTGTVSIESLRNAIDKNLQREIEQFEQQEGKRISLSETAKLEARNIQATIDAIKPLPEFTERGENIFEGKQELLKSLREDLKFQKDKIKSLKEEKVTRTKSQVLRAKISNVKRGFRTGRIKTKAEIKAVQNEIVNMITSADIKPEDTKGFLRSLKNIQTEEQFKKQFPSILKRLDKFEQRMRKERERSKARQEIIKTAKAKDLKKVENLRKFMKLPALKGMTTNQLKQFNEELKNFQDGDEFLSLRKLQTVKNTDLQGIRTVREAKEKLSEKMGVSVESVQNIKVSPLDKFLFDTALARKNAFYQFLVDETNASLLDGEQRFLEVEREIDERVKKARESRKLSLIDRAIPTDEIVFDWLEAANKEEISKEMTAQELELAGFMQKKFMDYRDYLIEHKVLEKYRSNYITHIRRGFLEAWKEDGLVDAFKEVFTQYQQDEAVFKILEDDTQNILPLEKFFQFAMKRKGGLKPSKNVSKAFKAYTRAMFKKQSLDKIVPALDIYAYTLSPKEITPRGLQMNRRLIKFVREWVNNKRGRKTDLGGILPQNGIVDMSLRLIDSFITLIDLGLNVPVGVTVQVGESVTTFVNLGSKKVALGISRAQTKKGKKILRDNESLIGKDVWRDLSDTADTLGDKFHKTLFFLFSTANIRSNRIHLLGSLTKQEWNNGEISKDRLAQIQREIGRFRNVRGAKSIFGSTAAGSALTKYKTWALPVFNTIISDIATVTKMTGRGEFKQTIKSQEFNELYRSITTMSVMMIAMSALIDDEDDSFAGEVFNKARRESLTILQAIDPTALSSVRLLAFLEDLSIALKQFILMEEFKTRPGLKGVSRFRKTLIPRAMEQFLKEDDSFL